MNKVLVAWQFKIPLEDISGGERIFEKIKINYKPNLIIYEKVIICTADAYCGKGERAE